MDGGYNVLSMGTPEQIERYLLPTLRGERADAYAVTEAGAGSDPGAIEGDRRAQGDGYRLRGEKWFVTSGDVADFYIVMVNVVDGDERLPTLFLVDRDRRASRSSTTRRSPTATRTATRRSASTSTWRTTRCSAARRRSAAAASSRTPWFVEERIHIAARCVGAMRRLLARGDRLGAGAGAVRHAHLRLTRA